MNRNAFLPIVLVLMSSSIFADVNNANSTPSNTVSSSAQKEHRDAIEIIIQDHNHIRKMIAQLDKNLGSNIEQSHSIFNELKDFLTKHETMEQKVWYPELEKNDKLKDIISKLKKEEQDASDEIKEIDDTKDDKKWASKVKKLTKDVGHHAKDEETKLFPKVRKTLNKSSLEELGDKLNDYRQQNDMQS